jgi:hypothetical protein
MKTTKRFAWTHLCAVVVGMLCLLQSAAFAESEEAAGSVVKQSMNSLIYTHWGRDDSGDARRLCIS